jgi:preprotein translocase subunit SecG
MLGFGVDSANGAGSIFHEPRAKATDRKRAALWQVSGGQILADRGRGREGGNFRFTPPGFPPIFRALMQIVINFLLAINVIVSLLIILLVLMQRPKNEGLGAAFGGGMTENLFGAQTSNVLQTITRWLGGLFFSLTLLVSWLIVKKDFNRSALQQRLSAPTVIPATPAPALPKDVPVTLPEAATPPVKPGEAPSTPELENSIKKLMDDAAKGKPAPEGTAPAPAPEVPKAAATPAPATPAEAPAPTPEAPKP